MTQQVYSLSISARAILNLHSLNNEGGEGNQIQTRMVDIVYYDEEGKPRQANVNAISGDMFKHIQVEHLQRIAKEKELALCKSCIKVDPNRISADPDFQNQAGKQKRIKVDGKDKFTFELTDSQAIDLMVAKCVVDDLAGNLVTQKGDLNPREARSLPRKSVMEYGWVTGIPNATFTDSHFHVKYVREKAENKDINDRSSNLGQSIFHRPVNSGVYAIVSNFEISRIGYNDINQQYVANVDRQARYKALLESILYSFIQMNGAMRNTQLPHLVALHGVVAVSHGIAPAPTVSPINPAFVGEIKGTRDVLNAIHGNAVIDVHEFADLKSLAAIMQGLIQNTEPYTMKIGTSN